MSAPGVHNVNKRAELNATAADRGGQVVEFYKKLVAGGGEYSDDEMSAVSDLLADVQHYCDGRDDVDFESAEACAYTNHGAEVAEARGVA